MSGSAPRRMDLRGRPFEGEVVESVARHLEQGGVLAYPTETVYGFGAACDPAGVAAVARLKGRDAERPFIILLPDAEHASELAWSEEARELAGVFWPGALTLVLQDPEERFPPGIRSPRGTVAVRVSPHPLVRELMAVWDAPLISTSANPTGETPARSGVEALAVARELGAGPELLVLDVGTLPPSEPSTVLDCSGEGVRVLREGSVPLERLGCVLPHLGEGGRG